MNAEDKEFLLNHFRKFAKATVGHEEEIEEFEAFAIPKIEEDPEYWSERGWEKMHDMWLDHKYPKKESVVNVDKLIERVLNGESPTRLIEAGHYNFGDEKGDVDNFDRTDWKDIKIAARKLKKSFDPDSGKAAKERIETSQGTAVVSYNGGEDVSVWLLGKPRADYDFNV